MLPATPEADELQQLPLELPRYLLVALRESGGHRAYARLLPPYVTAAPRAPAPLTVYTDTKAGRVKTQRQLQQSLRARGTCRHTLCLYGYKDVFPSQQSLRSCSDGLTTKRHHKS